MFRRQKRETRRSHAGTAWWPTSNSPCQQPQAANVQLAPCHRPPSTIVAIKLNFWRAGLQRLPPSGIYR